MKKQICPSSAVPSLLLKTLDKSSISSQTKLGHSQKTKWYSDAVLLMELSFPIRKMVRDTFLYLLFLSEQLNVINLNINTLKILSPLIECRVLWNSHYFVRDCCYRESQKWRHFKLFRSQMGKLFQIPLQAPPGFALNSKSTQREHFLFHFWMNTTQPFISSQTDIS